MARAMYASVQNAGGRWESVRVYPNGYGAGQIPGSFDTKPQADENARRNLEPSK